MKGVKRSKWPTHRRLDDHVGKEGATVMRNLIAVSVLAGGAKFAGQAVFGQCVVNVMA